MCDFNVVIDSTKSLSGDVNNKEYGFDFGVMDEGNYHVSFAFSSVGFNSVDDADTDPFSIHIPNIGSQLRSYKAGDALSAKTSSLIGFIKKHAQNGKEYYKSEPISNPPIKVKLTPTASSFRVELRNSANLLATTTSNYFMILSFKKI